MKSIRVENKIVTSIPRLSQDLQTDQTGKQEEYAKRYHTELALDRAEQYLKEHLGSDTRLRPKAWKVEVSNLTAQKDRFYQEEQKLKEEVTEAETVKRCAEQRNEKSKTHDASLQFSREYSIILVL